MAIRSGARHLKTAKRPRWQLAMVLATAALLAGCGSDDAGDGTNGPGPDGGWTGVAPEGDPSIQARINGEVLRAVPNGTEYSTPREVHLDISQPYLALPGELSFTLDCDLWEPEPPLGYFPEPLRISVQKTLWRPLENLVGQSFSCGRIIWHGGVCVPCEWGGDCDGYYANEGDLMINLTEWEPETNHIAGTFSCAFLDTSSLAFQEDPDDPVRYTIADGRFSATYTSGTK